MTLTTTKTVREYAIETPQTIPVFEKLGIDFCCGGNRPLDEACAAAKLNLDQVLAQIEAATVTPARLAEKELLSGSLSELIAHIVRTHHVFLRTRIPEIGKLTDKVYEKHGANHPELGQVRAVFHALGEELMTHLLKEENILFPFIERTEDSVVAHEPVLPPPFGTVANPVRMMEREHDNAGIALRSLRGNTNNFTPPADACTSFQALYTALADFEKDLHQHIHLENNVLFPRAMQMEKSVAR